MGPFGWIPFGGSVAGLALFIAATTYLIGMFWAGSRRLLYVISAVAAVGCVILARNWPDRAAAVAIAAATVSQLRSGSGDE